jgi:SAM-dependent methyltransferase
MYVYMYSVEACPCCLSRRSSERWAIVAPFLAHFAVGQPPFLCKLLECSDCSFRFFNVRLTPDEVDRLYSEYRGERYFAQRHRWEFWYSRKVNSGISGDPKEIADRVAALEKLALPHVDQQAVGTVLDYGGDRGQFIPKSLGESKYVFEMSNAVPVDGVTRIATREELQGRQFDFVMILCVLEHCSDPANVLDQVRSCLHPGSLLCVTVPYERYGVRFAGKSRLYRSYLNALLRFPSLLFAADFYSSAARIRLGFVPPLGFAKCHEHLNYFNRKSMAALLERTGFEIIDSKIDFVASYPVRSETLLVMARLRQ